MLSRNFISACAILGAVCSTILSAHFTGDTYPLDITLEIMATIFGLAFGGTIGWALNRWMLKGKR